MCVGYTDDDCMAIISQSHKCLISFLFLWGGWLIFEKGGLEKGIWSSFFHKDICFAWISNTYPKLFTRRLTSYALQKYSRNIFNLFKCKKPNGKYWMKTSHPCGKHVNKTLRHPWLKAFHFHGFFHFKKWLTYEVFFCVCDLTVLEPKIGLVFLLASHQ